MHLLSVPLLVIYYVVMAVYLLIAAGVATSCLVAVGAILVRRLAGDAVDYFTYPT
jgi:hypothetical protein